MFHPLDQARAAFIARRAVRQTMHARDWSMYRATDQGRALARAPFVPGNLNSLQLQVISRAGDYYAPMAYQDGPDFYDSATGELLRSYPSLVKNDHDVNGAENAREAFTRDFPEYTFEGE